MPTPSEEPKKVEPAAPPTEVPSPPPVPPAPEPEDDEDEVEEPEEPPRRRKVTRKDIIRAVRQEVRRLQDEEPSLSVSDDAWADGARSDASSGPSTVEWILFAGAVLTLLVFGLGLGERKVEP